MRYQEYIIGKEICSNPCIYDFRKFSVPIHSVAGSWLPAGEPFEETHLCHRFDMMISVYEFQVYTDNTCGYLDDMPCPEGWLVMARYWLPDDYVPPTEEEVEEQRQAAIGHLKKMGVWRDPS